MNEEDPFAQSMEAPRSRTGWLVMFADLLSLLLTFFVLIFSMNAVQIENWRSVVTTFSDRLNPTHALVTRQTWGGKPEAKLDTPLSLKIEYLGTVIAQKLGQDPVFQKCRVQFLDDRLVISMPSDVFFEKDGATFKNNGGRHVLEELGGILHNVRSEVGVVGHAAPTPSSDEDLPSNWELSLIRAIAVSRVLQDSGYNKPIVTFGNGDARLEDLGSKLTFDEKSQLAQRVDILVREADSEGWAE